MAPKCMEQKNPGLLLAEVPNLVYPPRPSAAKAISNEHLEGFGQRADIMRNTAIGDHDS